MQTRAQPAAVRFWAALGEGRFDLPRCADCAAWQEPDARACVRCASSALTWEAAPASGVVFSVMEPHGAPDSEARTIAVVDLDAGPRMMGVMVGSRGRSLTGMRVAVAVPSAPGAELLPLFIAAPAQPAPEG